MAASPEATLLVDGYNIIGAWSALTIRRDRDGLEAAREELIAELANYSAFQGYQTRLVFDAHQRNDAGSSEVITDTLEIYYTDFGETADTYIEVFCAQPHRRIRPTSQRLIVATSDRAQKLTVLGYGAEWMSAQQLINDIEYIAVRIRQTHKHRKKQKARLLAHSLDPDAKKQLEKWRHGHY